MNGNKYHGYIIRLMMITANTIIANDKYSCFILIFFVENVGNLLASKKAITTIYRPIIMVWVRILIPKMPLTSKSKIMGIRASKAPQGAGTPVKKYSSFLLFAS